MLRCCALLVTLFSLGACVVHKGPIWLESGKVDMRDYADANVVVLHPEINPLYKMDGGDLGLVQEAVSEAFDDVFDVARITAIPSQQSSEVVKYPYNEADVRALAKLYNADAALSVSIFTYTPRDEFKDEMLGMRVMFVDADDEMKVWVASFEYEALFDNLARSPVFGTTVRSDLFAVKNSIRSGEGFANFVARTASLGLAGRRKAGRPALNVTSPSLEHTRLNELGGAIDTNDSHVEIYVLTQDEDGVRRLEFENRSTDYARAIDLPAFDNGALPTRSEEFAIIPLDVGRNDVAIRAINSDGKRNAREITFIRSRSTDIYSMSVGVEDYMNTGLSTPHAEELAREFAQIVQPEAALSVPLVGRDATRMNVMLGIQDIGGRTLNNESGLSVFYFVGNYVVYEGRGYLVPFDYLPKYPPIYGVEIEYLGEYMGRNSTIILDLCAEDADPVQLHKVLRNALVSLDSCSGEDDTLAGRIGDRMKKGMDFRAALESTRAEIGRGHVSPK